MLSRAKMNEISDMEFDVDMDFTLCANELRLCVVFVFTCVFGVTRLIVSIKIYTLNESSGDRVNFTRESLCCWMPMPHDHFY